MRKRAHIIGRVVKPNPGGEIGIDGINVRILKRLIARGVIAKHSRSVQRKALRPDIYPSMHAPLYNARYDTWKEVDLKVMRTAAKIAFDSMGLQDGKIRTGFYRVLNREYGGLERGRPLRVLLTEYSDRYPQVDWKKFARVFGPVLEEFAADNIRTQKRIDRALLDKSEPSNPDLN